MQLIVNASTGKKVKPLQDMHGNIIGYFPVGTKESANIQRKSEESYDAYGPIISEGSILEGFSTEIDLSEVVAKAHTWRGKRVDPTGYIWMGTRYYEPGSGRFPVYYCDADGRFASAVYEQAKEDPIGAMQYGLDAAGMIPLFGIAPALVNALVHSVRGNNVDAMLSLAAAIPIVGDVGRGVNIVSDAAKMAVKVGESTVKAEAKGGLNLFKWNDPSSMTDKGWKSGDYMLYLPNKKNPKANYKQNSGRLRERMHEGDPIYDSYHDPVTGKQIDAGLSPYDKTGRFLNAERKLLESRHWKYVPDSRTYYPPSHTK